MRTQLQTGLSSLEWLGWRGRERWRGVLFESRILRQRFHATREALSRLACYQDELLRSEAAKAALVIGHGRFHNLENPASNPELLAAPASRADALEPPLGLS